MEWVQTALAVLRVIPPAYQWVQEWFPLSDFDHIRFRTWLRQEPTANITLKLYVESANDRSSPVVLSSASFIFKEPSVFRHDAHVSKDTASGRYHCKFKTEKGDAHLEFSYLLRPGATTTSYIGLDPAHSEGDIQNMLGRKKFGYFYVYVTWWTDKEVPITRLVRVDLS
jgi:hypothetical protein